MALKSSSPKLKPPSLTRIQLLGKRGLAMITALKRYSRYIRFWVVLSIVFGIIGLASLPKPNVLVAASIQTETVEITILRPDSPSIILPVGLLETVGDPTCLNDLVVSPSQDSKVYYSKNSQGLFIALEGQFSWRSADGRSGSAVFGNVSITKNNEICSYALPIRLPISGLLNIGTVAGTGSGDDEVPLVILKGSLDIYGRATDRIFGIPVSLFSSFLPMEPDRLYLADQIKIPAGSKLASNSAIWGGFVDVLWGASNRGLYLEASTNARTLQIEAPAPRVSSNNDIRENQKADVISLTFGARLSNDPNIRWVFAAVSFLFLILGIFFQLPQSKE